MDKTYDRFAKRFVGELMKEKERGTTVTDRRRNAYNLFVEPVPERVKTQLKCLYDLLFLDTLVSLADLVLRLRDHLEQNITLSSTINGAVINWPSHDLYCYVITMQDDSDTDSRDRFVDGDEFDGKYIVCKVISPVECKTDTRTVSTLAEAACLVEAQIEGTECKIGTRSIDYSYLATKFIQSLPVKKEESSPAAWRPFFTEEEKELLDSLSEDVRGQLITLYHESPLPTMASMSRLVLALAAVKSKHILDDEDISIGISFVGAVINWPSRRLFCFALTAYAGAGEESVRDGTYTVCKISKDFSPTSYTALTLTDAVCNILSEFKKAN